MGSRSGSSLGLALLCWLAAGCGRATHDGAEPAAAGEGAGGATTEGGDASDQAGASPGGDSVRASGGASLEGGSAGDEHAGGAAGDAAASTGGVEATGGAAPLGGAAGDAALGGAPSGGAAVAGGVFEPAGGVSPLGGSAGGGVEPAGGSSSGGIVWTADGGASGGVTAGGAAGAAGAASGSCPVIFGVNFSPYYGAEDPNRGDGQITDQELRARMEAIAPSVSWIRSFGCNEDLREVGEYGHALGLHTAVGAWIGQETEAGLAENQRQIGCLCEEIAKGNVDLAIVGSEALLRGDVTAEELLGYLTQVKACVAASGHPDTPVTYADVYGVLLANQVLLDASDVVFANLYPYWEGVVVDQAVAYVNTWYQMLEAAAPGKPVWVSESGWPSCGDAQNDAVPSPENAGDYFVDFVSWAEDNEVPYLWFSAVDEPWKAAHEGPQGACWGLWDETGQLKPEMARVFQCERVDDDFNLVESAAPITDFFSIPDLQTNLDQFLVAAHTDPANGLWIGGAEVDRATAMDPKGNFAVVVPLSEGPNAVTLEIRAPDGTPVASTTRTITFTPGYRTEMKKLYVAVEAANASGASPRPQVSGTVVIDLERSVPLGFLSAHVMAASPVRAELYTEEKTILDAATHAVTGTLGFTPAALAHNAFVVSPDGARVYAGSEALDLETGELVAMPEGFELTVGATEREGGGPAISADGALVYAMAGVYHTADNACEPYPAVHDAIDGHYAPDYETDFLLFAGDTRLAVANYSWAVGRLYLFDNATRTQLATVSGLGDYLGELALSADGRFLFAGSDGNPASATDGRLSVLDAETLEVVTQRSVALANNLALDGDRVYVSAGFDSALFPRAGVDVYVFDESSPALVLVEHHFLGVNGFVFGERNDGIEKITVR